MPTSPAVLAFRARFDGVGDADRAAQRDAATDRLAQCLELHGLALWMDIARVMAELGASRPEAVVAEVNRRRLEASPMPPSLRDRWLEAHRWRSRPPISRASGRPQDVPDLVAGARR